MKKTFLTAFLFIATVLTQAQNINVNDKFPIDKLDFYSKTNNPKIVVFMPSLYDDCEYASMLTNAFYYYFQEGLTFEDEKIKPKFDIILIVNDIDKWKTEDNSLARRVNQNILNGMNVNYDSTGKYFDKIGINKFQDAKIHKSDTIIKDINILSLSEIPLTRNHSSTLFLLDSNNTILLKDEDYRSQGEHLKPLDFFIKEKFCNSKINRNNKYANLKIDDKAPNFIVEGQNDIDSDTNNLKVITFYPAAFSGSLKQRIDFPKMAECVVQLRSFDLIKIDIIPDKSKIKEVKRYAVSNAPEKLLKRWTITLGSYNTSYINDNDNSIAEKYGAFNPSGYNNRLTYIVDEKNIIRYIDKEFTDKSEAILSEKINEILKEK